MKKLIFISILFPLMLQAQTDVQGVYLLNEFTTSVATSKQGPPIKASFNYDCVKQQMQFEEEGEILKLESINNIDTLYLGDHKMVPYMNRFLEVVHIVPHYILLIDHKRKIINEGKRGAMGVTTQAGVEDLDLSKSGIAHKRMTMTDHSVHKCKDESGYVIIINNKSKKFNNTKSYIKIFPGKKEQIENYIKENQISFKEKAAVISLIDFTIK